MATAAAKLAFAASFPAFLAGEALAQTQRVPLPSPVEVGRALAVENACLDQDGFTLCDPSQPIGATFRQILCVVYGSDLAQRPIVRCVYKGARMMFSGERRSASRDYGDGAIDVIYIDNSWLPNRR